MAFLLHTINWSHAFGSSHGGQLIHVVVCVCVCVCVNENIYSGGIKCMILI